MPSPKCPPFSGPFAHQTPRSVPAAVHEAAPAEKGAHPYREPGEPEEEDEAEKAKGQQP